MAQTAFKEPESLVDRRGGERMALLRPVQFIVDGHRSIGELLDIGEFGMRLRTTRPLSCGSLVRCTLPLPLERYRQLEAKVVWQRGTIVGLRFEKACRELRASLRAMIEKMSGGRSASA